MSRTGAFGFRRLSDALCEITLTPKAKNQQNKIIEEEITLEDEVQVESPPLDKKVQCKKVTDKKVQCKTKIYEKMSGEIAAGQKVTGEKVPGQKVPCQKVPAMEVQYEKVPDEKDHCEKVLGEKVDCEKVPIELKTTHLRCPECGGHIQTCSYRNKGEMVVYGVAGVRHAHHVESRCQDCR